MKQNIPPFQSKGKPFTTCFFIIFFTLLIVGGSLRTFWRYGDPTWQFWMGEMLASSVILFSGISIFIAISLNPNFIIRLRSRKIQQGEVTFVERIKWYAVACAMMIIGVLLLIVFLGRLLANCNPPGC